MNLIGGFAIRTERRLASLSNRKACCMLAYLALSESGSETRERLAGLLWSETPEDNARMSLRQCLRQLHEGLANLGIVVLVADRESIALDLSKVAVDVTEVTAELAAGRIPDLLAQDDVGGRLLYGLESIDPAFHAWLMVRRHALAEHLSQSLDAILGNPALAEPVRLRAAEALIKLDSTHETAYQALIRQTAEKGNIAGALRLYKRLWDLLDAEYDMEPSEATQRLIAEIKLGGARPDPAPVAPPPAAPPPIALPPAGLPQAPPMAIQVVERPWIGVAAFLQQGTPPDQGYIVEGFRRELIAALVRFREWVIVDGGPPSQNDARQDDRRVFDYELEGACYPAEQALQLSIILKDAASRRFIWSEKYVLGLDGWFKAQQRIVRRVALALNVYLSADRVARRLAEPDVSFETYDRWLRGQSLVAEWRPEAENAAEAIFREIIAETPDFAPAHASLASLFNSRHIVFPGIFRNAELEAEALSCATRAVELDPLDTRSQLALAWSNVMRGRYEQAELHYGLSFDLNGSDPATLISCAQGLAFCGRVDEARRLANTTLATNPMMPNYHWGYLAGIGFACGDYEMSVVAAERAHDVIFNLPGWKAAALAQLGRKAEAQGEARHLVDLVKRNWVGDGEGSDDAVVRWFLHSFPIRDPVTRDRLREGLREAGLPVPPD